MLSGGESVTKDDADILCAFHEGWVAELDHPGENIQFKDLLHDAFSGINYWLKSKLLDTTEPGEFNQFWLGATTEVRHFKELIGRLSARQTKL